MTQTQQTQTQNLRRRKLPQWGTGEFWAAEPETQNLIDVCGRLNAALSAFDAIEFSTRDSRYTDREPLMRWAQLMAGHLDELEQEARGWAFAALDAEEAERAAQERAGKGASEDEEEE